MGLIDKITNIADAIRAKTGKDDKLTLEQMVAEIKGISGGLKCDIGSFVLDSDTYNPTGTLGIPHNLGKAPKYILVWTDEFSNIAEYPYSDNKETMLGLIAIDSFMGLPQRLTSSTTNGGIFTINFYLARESMRLTPSIPTSMSYVMQEPPTENMFFITGIGSSTLWRAGVEYKYFVSEGFGE